MKSWKELEEIDILSRAKDAAWNALTAKKQAEYLSDAITARNARLAELAEKCCKEAIEAMSDPDYVSRADSSVYLPAPHINAKAHAMIMKLTPEEIRQGAVEAGIYTADGKLTKHYASKKSKKQSKKRAKKK